MYEVGQIINIGYYGGFRHQTLIKTQAEITKVAFGIVHIRVKLSYGVYRKMFGYEKELKELEDNFNK